VRHYNANASRKASADELRRGAKAALGATGSVRCAAFLHFLDRGRVSSLCMGKRGLFGHLNTEGFQARGATVSAKESRDAGSSQVPAGRARAGKAHKSVIYPALIVLLADCAVVPLTTGALAASAVTAGPGCRRRGSLSGANTPWTNPGNIATSGSATAGLPATSPNLSNYWSDQLRVQHPHRCDHNPASGDYQQQRRELAIRIRQMSSNSPRTAPRRPSRRCLTRNKSDATYAPFTHLRVCISPLV